MGSCQWLRHLTPRLRHCLSRQRQSHLASIKIQEPQARGQEGGAAGGGAVIETIQPAPRTQYRGRPAQPASLQTITQNAQRLTFRHKEQH